MTLASGAKTAIADTRFPKKIALSADGSRLYAAVGDTNVLQVQEGGRCRRGSWVWRLGVAVVLSGHCRVVCTEPPRVQVMLSTGATTTVATGLSYAYGVAPSADGTYLYISEGAYSSRSAGSITQVWLRGRASAHRRRYRQICCKMRWGGESTS